MGLGSCVSCLVCVMSEVLRLDGVIALQIEEQGRFGFEINKILKNKKTEVGGWLLIVMSSVAGLWIQNFWCCEEKTAVSLDNSRSSAFVKMSAGFPCLDLGDDDGFLLVHAVANVVISKTDGFGALGETGLRRGSGLAVAVKDGWGGFWYPSSEKLRGRWSRV